MRTIKKKDKEVLLDSVKEVLSEAGIIADPFSMKGVQVSHSDIRIALLERKLDFLSERLDDLTESLGKIEIQIEKLSRRKKT